MSITISQVFEDIMKSSRLIQIYYSSDEEASPQMDRYIHQNALLSYFPDPEVFFNKFGLTVIPITSFGLYNPSIASISSPVNSKFTA